MGLRYEAERKESVEGNRGEQLSRFSLLISQEITEPTEQETEQSPNGTQ